MHIGSFRPDVQGGLLVHIGKVLCLNHGDKKLILAEREHDKCSFFFICASAEEKDCF